MSDETDTIETDETTETGGLDALDLGDEADGWDEQLPGQVAENPVPLPDMFHDIGLDWNGLKPSFDEWARLGPNLLRMEKAHQFWVGDWFHKGEEMWGEDAYQAFDPERFDAKTIANYAWVASQVPIKERHAGLSWTHHRIAAELPTMTLRRKALKRAVQQELTTRQLQQYVDELKPAEEEGGRRRAKSTHTWSLSFTLNADDEATGDTIHANLQEFLSKGLADAGVEPTKVTPSKS